MSHASGTRFVSQSVAPPASSQESAIPSPSQSGRAARYAAVTLHCPCAHCAGSTNGDPSRVTVIVSPDASSAAFQIAAGTTTTATCGEAGQSIPLFWNRVLATSTAVAPEPMVSRANSVGAPRSAITSTRSSTAPAVGTDP
jgi:hypothetical protein